MNRTEHPYGRAWKVLSQHVGDSRSIPASLVRAYAVANVRWRAAVLDRLVRSAGSLALAVLGGGAFVKFLTHAGSVSIDDAARVTASQLYDLACYVQQANPGLLEQLLRSLPPVS